MAAQDYVAVVQQLYVSYFGRPADYYGLDSFTKNLNAINAPKTFAELNAAVQGPGNEALKQLVNGFDSSDEAKALYGTDTSVIGTSKFIAAIYENVLGREADPEGLAFWVNAVATGQLSRSNAAAAITAGALANTSAQGLLDAQTVGNKLAVATNFTAAINTTSEINGFAGDEAAAAARALLAQVNNTTSPEAFQTNVEQALAAIVTGSNLGETFALTKGLDNVVGTAGNDVIIGAISSNAELNTLSSIDLINGGAGIDTLKIVHEAGAIALGNLSNVEVVEVESIGAVTIDSSAATGVTNLNVTKSVGNVNATAGATTDITVVTKENGAGSAVATTINGGDDVTVNVTDAGATSNPDTITIGGTTAAKGDVVVNATASAYDATVGAISLGAITVTGGETVTVTQKVGASTTAGTDTSATTVTQGAVTVNANASTTTITVKQDAAVTANNAAFTTGGVTETASVKFGALKSGDAVTVNGLKFTAKVDLTAAEVASAFSNLATASVIAAGDTQSAAVATKGVYTLVADTSLWTSAAAEGDTVVFTAVAEESNVTDLLPSLTNTSTNSVAPVVTTVQGKADDATNAGGVAGVAAGVVTVAGAGATVLKVVSIDGYSATGSKSTATSAALDTLNLSNGGDFELDNAAVTLALNLKAVGIAAADATDTTPAVLEDRALLNLDNAATKTLNVKSDGVNTVSLDLAGATATTTLNVSGSGLLDADDVGTDLGNVATIKVTETAGLDLGVANRTNVTSVDTTETTGTVTIGIEGNKATYAGGAGVDNVTITNAATAISKSIDLGAGDDTLDITAVTVGTPTANLEGGEGTDTLAMSAANAVALSANATFEGKIAGFEQLSIDKATTSGTINLANLDDISYVISKNSTGSTATKAVFTVTLAGAPNANDTITFAGTTYTVTGTPTPEALALQLAGQSYTGWVVKSVAGAAITFEAAVAGATAVPANSDFVFVDTGNDTATDASFTVAGTAGVGAGASAALTINNLASGGTLELTDTGSGAIVGVTGAAAGTADVLNVVVNAAGNVGTVTAANVETVNVHAENVAAGTLTVAATAATTINVDGAGDLTLGVTANTKLATVDASTATGSLTLDLTGHTGVAVTVKGGLGDDVLTASATLADLLNGGAGDDILFAGSNGAKLTGGEGNDVFVLQANSKEANTYSSITDFTAGDQLRLLDDSSAAVTGFAKLTASLNEATSVFQNFADAAIAQAAVDTAVWFSFKGNSYVVIDQDTNSTAFTNGVDSVIELVGVANLDNVSWNGTYGTIELVG